MTTSQRTAERQEILQQTRIVWGRCLEMARRNYVNPSDRGFEAQVAQFLANLGPVKTALGLPANWEAQLQTRKNSFTTALNSLDLAEANYRQAKQTKDAARRSLVGERPAPPLLDPDAVYSFTRRAE
jgi:hypothetical protein